MRTLKRVLAVTACAAMVVAATLALAVWLIARDEVAALRSARDTEAAPLPATIRNAIVAAEDPILERPRLPLRSLRPRLPSSPRIVSCGPSHIAWMLVRPPSPPRPTRRSRIEAVVTMYVVAHVFPPEDLLRIYVSKLYLGRVDGRDVLGVEAASRVYFGKPSRDLTTAEAATLAAMARSPNVYSPRKYPERVLPRRNRVLERMYRSRFIDESEYRRAISEPL